MRLGLSRRRRFSAAALTIIVIAALVFAVGTAINRMKPAFVEYAMSYANNTANEVVNSALEKAYSDGGYSSSSLIRESGGSLNSLETDTAKANMLKAAITKNIQDAIASDSARVIYVPLGSAANSYFFAGLGPKIPVRIYPVSIVNTDFRDDFESAGINQVRHRLYLDVSVQMSFVGITFAENRTVNTQALISETIIVGDTPSYYGSGVVSAPMPQERNSD